MIPEKIIENSEGVLQIYSIHNSHVFPKKINNLMFSSSDSSIIRIIGIDNDTSNLTHLRIKAVSPGTASIELAAPGFVSQKIPITIYENTNIFSHLSIKITPNAFTGNSPKTGYVSVEMMNKNDLPVYAINDTQITLTTDKDTISLENPNITIKAGKYFAVEKFKVKQSGSAVITASAKYTKPAIGTVNIAIPSQLTLKSYVFPNKINNFAASVAYVIVQLQDASGNPVLASNDISISSKVTNSSGTKTVNTSDNNAYIESHAPIIIKKDTYWGYAPMTVKAGTNGTFDVSISNNKGYLISPSAQFSTTSMKFIDDKSAKLDLLPILKTGKKELIGILHLEDENSEPVIAKYSIPVEIDSSDITSLFVDKPVLLKGSGATPVFGTASINSANVPVLHVVTFKDQTVSPSLLSLSGSVTLIGEPLITKILRDTEFPFSIYMKDGSGALTYFTHDFEPVTNSDGIVFSSSQKAQNGESIITNNATMTEKNGTIILSDGKTQSVISLGSTSNTPSKISLQYIDPLSLNFNNTVILQTLDSADQPRFADRDIILKMSSRDNSIQLPQNITIKKGEYYKIINISPKKEGQDKISILSDNIEVPEYTLNVENTKPQIVLSVPDQIQPGNSFLATVNVQLYNTTISGVNINWASTGAVIQQKDSITNQDGIANALFLSENKERIVLSASVSGFGITPTKITKVIQLNATSSYGNLTNNAKPKIFGINGIDPIPILIITIIITSGVFLKRKSIAKKFKIKINVKKK